MSDFSRVCFFCGETIGSDERKTAEHIIPNKLLGKLGIKLDAVTGLTGEESQWSRKKVPAHQSCNNTFGSRYEMRILEMLDAPDSLNEAIRSEASTFSIILNPTTSPATLMATWLTKIFYGLFYWDYLRGDEASKSVASQMLRTKNFKLMRDSYKDGVGFCLPSSLYAFRSKNDCFDMATFCDPPTIMVKIGFDIFILCVGDGFLTKNYLMLEKLEDLERIIAEQERSNIQLSAQRPLMAHIAALRSCIPKNPSFIYSDKTIHNTSLFTSAINPDEIYAVDDELVSQRTLENQKLLGLTVV